jgi:hypothetical protein
VTWIVKSLRETNLGSHAEGLLTEIDGKRIYDEDGEIEDREALDAFIQEGKSYSKIGGYNL